VPSAERAAAHAFVADLAVPELNGDDLHHLERVLRLRPGERVTVSDGQGGLLACRFRAGATLEVDGDAVFEERPQPAITVGFAVVKGERPEWTVQKLTEVGVDRIVPLSTARSVVRWDGDRADRNVRRLNRAVREAAMQSRRRWLPVVEPLRPVDALVAELGDSVAFAHPGGSRPTLTRPSVVIGPEGGWTDEELAGRPTLGLGSTILRAETAAIAAAVLLGGLRQNLVQPG
jgi:16S rRNA (uracil1498-N3)-methyltransferase